MNIFLVSFEIFERPAKIAMALRCAGHDVTLIHCVDTNDVFLKSCFNRIIKIENSSQIEDAISIFNIKFVHIFSKFADQLALYFVTRPGIKTIFDYKDIFEGLIKHEYSSEVYKQQELLIFNSDYLCNRDFQIVNYEKFKGKSVKNKLFYPDLVWSNQPIIKRINQIKNINFNKIRIVLIGNFTLERQEPQFAGNGYFFIINELLKQGFDVNVYPANPHVYNREYFTDYINLANKDKNLVLHDYISQVNLQDEIFNYDFAIHLQQSHLFNNLNIGHIPELNKTAIPTRLMDYIGSGLPIIFNKEYTMINKINYRYNIGVAISRNEFFNLKEVLKDRYNKQLKSGQLANATYYLSSNRWIGRLIKLYQKFEISKFG